MSKRKLNSIPLITTSIVAVLYFPASIRLHNGENRSATANSGQVLAESPRPDVTDKPDTEGVGRRDDCILGEKRLTVLTPIREEKKNIGLTVAAAPTLFFYIPSTRSTVDTLDFILQDQNKNTRYRTRLAVPKTPGIINLKIPESAQLQVGESYDWTFAIICKAGDRSEDEYVTGTIQRVRLTPELTAQLEVAKPKDIPAIYARAGIWHETLSSLVKLRQDYPQDRNLVDTWVRLLESVGLRNIAEEPLIEPEI